MLRFSILLVFLLGFFVSSAQVLDDTTKQIYSNKTVEFVYESDVLRNISRKYNPDSSLLYYHYSNPVKLSGWMYQDLGNVGTASRPVLFVKPADIGQTMGLGVNRLYTPDINQFKYYNSRSPYTYLGYQMGGGHTQANITHSQNINSRLNLTLNILKFNSTKQYGYQRSEDILVNHWSYDVSSNYSSKNNKYRFLAAFYHFNHKHFEQGGVSGGDSIQLKDIAQRYSQNYDAALSGTIYNRERWNNFHLYQQFLLKNSIQTFHTLDYERKYYGFQDFAFTDSLNAKEYGIAQQIPTDTLGYHMRFQTVSNKFGFKGIYKGVNYQVYGRHRIYRLTNSAFSNYTTRWENELYVGGLLGYVFADSTNTLDARAEFSSDQNYLLDANLFYKGFHIAFYNSAVPAGLFYQKFTNGLIDFSNKDLRPINTTNFSAKFPLKYRSFRLIPELQWTNTANQIYLPDVRTVTQSNGGVNVLSFVFDLRYTTQKFTLNHKYYHNTTNSALISPVPKHIHITNLEYNFLYAKVLRIYTGADFYYKSSYEAPSYSPLLNQFIAQNKRVGGTPVIDLYVKFPISKGRISLSYSYFNKLLGGIGTIARYGIFTTPGYLAQPNSFIIKIDWPLFD